MANSDLPDLEPDAKARIEAARNRGWEAVSKALSDGNRIIEIADAGAIGIDSDLRSWSHGQADLELLQGQTCSLLFYFDVIAYEYFCVVSAMAGFEDVLDKVAKEAQREFRGDLRRLETQKRWWQSRAQGRAKLQSVTSSQHNRTSWNDLIAQFRDLQSPHVSGVIRSGWWKIEGLPDEPSQGNTLSTRLCSAIFRTVWELGFTERQVDICVNAWLDLLLEKKSSHRVGRSINNLCLASGEYCEQILVEFERQEEALKLPSKPTLADQETRKRRRAILKRYRLGTQIATREDLALHLGISVSALEGMISGDRTRYSAERLSEFLKKIGVLPEDW